MNCRRCIGRSRSPRTRRVGAPATTSRASPIASPSSSSWRCSRARRAWRHANGTCKGPPFGRAKLADMPFDSGAVAEVQAKVDLLAYVSQYVTLKKQGREYRGLCPFHSEKTPSFYLNADKQVWHCHGCAAGGDLIKFVERYENVDFPTALRMLAARAGV